MPGMFVTGQSSYTYVLEWSVKFYIENINMVVRRTQSTNIKKHVNINAICLLYLYMTNARFQALSYEFFITQFLEFLQ